MSRILVTGGTGFVGAALVPELVKAEHQIQLLVRPGTTRPIPCANQVQVSIADVFDEQGVAQAMQGNEVVIHLAATGFGPRLSVEQPLESARVNLWGTLNLLEAARRAGVKKFLFSSTYMVYGCGETILKPESPVRPFTPYALQKYQAELAVRQYAELYGMNALIFRLANVYGPKIRADLGWRPVIAIFQEKVQRGEPITIEGAGLQARDFIHVQDVVSGLMAGLAYDKPALGEVFNLASGQSTSMIELARLFGGPVTHLPARSQDMANATIDISKTQDFLGWEPKISIEAGIKELMS